MNPQELDAWIAENVMRWLFYDSEFQPTTDPASAMEVLKKCGEHGILNGEFKLPVSIFQRGDLKWVVSENFEDEEGSHRHCIVVECLHARTRHLRFRETTFFKGMKNTHFFAHVCQSGNLIHGTATIKFPRVEWSAGKQKPFSKNDRKEFNIWANHVADTLQKLYGKKLNLALV